MSTIRRLVSKNKRRYTDDGFDLDLSYICPNILAMGFPADKVEGMYRNNIDEVVRFLECKHGNNYKVYNLCSERVYDAKKFHNRVSSFPFDDHNPPRFELIKPFCEDVDHWLGKHKDNIAAIHCKAGKGRTGVMICCYLLHRRRFSVPVDVLKFYSLARTNNMKGVTIPSQIRYVNYYAALVNSNQTYKPTTLLLHSIIFETVPLQHSASLYFIISQLKVKLYTSNPDRLVRGDNRLIFDLDKAKPLCGDIKIEVCHKPVMRKEKLFHFWFNTFFVKHQKILDSISPTGERDDRAKGRNANGNAQQYYRCTHMPPEKDMITLTIKKSELDRANKDEANRLFSPNFRVVLIFSPMDSARDPSTLPMDSSSSCAAPTGSSSSSTSSSPFPNRSETESISHPPEVDDSLTDSDDEDDWKGVLNDEEKLCEKDPHYYGSGATPLQ